jgi:hypothetical protein
MGCNGQERHRAKENIRFVFVVQPYNNLKHNTADL